MAVEMKDSGIDWIGQIPEEWNVKRFKYCVEICNGRDYKDIEVDEGGYPVLGSGGEFARASKYSYDKPSVLLGRKGTIDKPMYYDKPFWTVDTMFYTRIPEYMNPRFVYYMSTLIRFDYYSTQTTLPSMTQTDLGSEKLPVPDKTEQKKIADFLDKQISKIDAIIKTNEQQLEILKKYKKSLITQTVTKGLNKNVKMKDSGVDWIGKIPYNWEMQRLKYVLTKNNPIRVGPFGTALTTSDYTDEGQWVYNQRVVLDKNFMENDTFISEEKAKELKGFKVFSGDLLITTRGTIGKVAKVPENCKDGVLHPCIIRFRVEEGKLPYKLINVLFNESDFVLDQITRFSNATTIDVIYSETLKNLIVPIIPQDELTVITSYLDKQCTKINCLINKKQQAINTMQKYKKSLIYEYVTGKKRIK